MGVYTDEKKLFIIAEPKTIHFDLPIEVSNSLLKHEVKFVIKYSHFLAEENNKKLD